MVYDYITEQPVLNNFFHPPPVIIDISLSGVVTHLPLTYQQLLGIMAIYRYLRLPHPFGMCRLPLSNEVETVNDEALSDSNKQYDGAYNINVGIDIYSFTDIDFFQGLLTGAQWNNLDPHSFIINLVKWQEKYVGDSDNSKPDTYSTTLTF